MNKFWKDRNDAYWAARGMENSKATHRELGDIPGITKAHDCFAWEDDRLVIKNPCKPFIPRY